MIIMQIILVALKLFMKGKTKSSALMITRAISIRMKMSSPFGVQIDPESRKEQKN